MQYDAESLLAADFGKDVRVFRDSTTGKVMVSENGQTMPLRQAISTGEAKVSRRGR
jgi:hypothetical protein